MPHSLSDTLHPSFASIGSIRNSMQTFEWNFQDQRDLPVVSVQLGETLSVWLLLSLLLMFSLNYFILEFLFELNCSMAQRFVYVSLSNKIGWVSNQRGVVCTHKRRDQEKKRIWAIVSLCLANAFMVYCDFILTHRWICSTRGDL